MEISRLIFTKETKEKMKEPINQFQKGRLRWAKLKEVNDNGKLSLAKNRQDILNAMGLPTGYGSPYSWVSSMINRGCLQEILTGFDKNNSPEYEYHLTDKNAPDYDTFGRKGMKKNKKEKVVKERSNREMCESRYKKLEELNNTGELSLIKTRRELAMAVGYKDEDFLKKGASWVNRMIRGKYIIETVLGFNNELNRQEYEYRLTNAKPKSIDDKQQVEKIADNMPQTIARDSVSSPIKIKITKQDICIEIELEDRDYAGEFVKQLVKGE